MFYPTLKTEDFLHEAQELEYQKWMQEKGFDLQEEYQLEEYQSIWEDMKSEE